MQPRNASGIISKGIGIVRYVGLLGALAALVFLGRGLWTPGVHSPISDPDDFRAFYCAGHATTQRADPYTTEPIRGCEHAAARSFGLAFAPQTVVPAPLPPYALAFFALFGALAFPLASTLWFFASLAALGVAVVVTVRLSGASPAIVAPAFALAGGLVSINEGQIAPLITAALCIAAFGLSRSRRAFAGLGLGLAMLEPHVAVTAFVTAWSDRGTRRAIVGTFVVLAALDLVAGGPSRTIEYFAHVLPLHARTEIAFFAQQFSLTTTAWSLGAAPSAALLLGTFDYVVMFVLGVVVAIRLQARYEERGFLVLLPPAFVLLGGSFIHLFQMEIALPLAFLAYAKLERGRTLIAFAILGLAIPTQFLVLASPLRTTFYPPPPASQRATPPRADDASSYAEITEMHVDAFGPRPAIRDALVAMLPKLPTWLALAALVAACIREAFAPRLMKAARAGSPSFR